MLVNRRTFLVKRGHIDEAVELLKTGADHLEAVPTFRVYGGYISPFDTVVLELEFENLTEYERFWTEWADAPESEVVLEKWLQITESGGTNEVWQLL